MNEKSFEITIEGMDCVSCAANIEQSLKQLVGINDVNISFSNKKGYIKFNVEEISPKEIIKSINDLGYKTELTSLNLEIPDISCASCIATIEKALSSHDAIINVSINLALKQANIEYIPELMSKDEINHVIT